MNQRKNLTSADSGIALYSQAIARLLETGEYDSWVNVHATLAIHNSIDYFLAWHRAYLYFFEKRLQEVVPGVTIPYWDWTRLQQVPPAFEIAGNPLDHPRDPGDIVPDLPSVDEVEGSRGLLQVARYRNFANQLEVGPHNRVHNWVGGDMSNIMISPSDPLFWCHHAYVDFIWDRWQKAHTPDGPSDPGRRLDIGSGRVITVREVLRVESLEYEYVSAVMRFAREAVGRDGCTLVFRPLGTEHHPTDVNKLAAPAVFSQAELRIEGIPHPKHRGYEARLFLNQPEATVGTPTSGNSRFLGYFDMPVMGEHGHQHPGMGTGATVLLDITDSVRELQAKSGDTASELDLSIAFVFLGSPDEFRFESMTLTFVG